MRHRRKFSRRTLPSVGRSTSMVWALAPMPLSSVPLATPPGKRNWLPWSFPFHRLDSRLQIQKSTPGQAPSTCLLYVARSSHQVTYSASAAHPFDMLRADTWVRFRFPHFESLPDYKMLAEQVYSQTFRLANPDICSPQS